MAVQTKKHLVSVIIINSRGETDWLKECIDSIKFQTYGIDNIELIVEDNTDKSRSIGKAWNDAVKKATGKFCLFVGDDDIIRASYIDDLVSTYERTIEAYPNLKAVTSYLTAFTGSGSETKVKKYDRYVTGMIDREFLLQNPFDEIRINRVDTDWYNKHGKVTTCAFWNHGYMYRGHPDQISKNGIINKQFDNVFFCNNTHFLTDFIADNFDHEKTILLPSYDHLQDRNAKLVFCDFGSDAAVEVSRSKSTAKKFLRVHRFSAHTPLIYKINFEGFQTTIFTSYHVKRYVETKLSKTVKNSVVIPLGVDVEKFKIKRPNEPVRKNKIGIVGYINRKKGFTMLKPLARSYPNFEFHILGQYQDEALRQYITEKSSPNIFIHSWRNNPADFYNQIDYILSLSYVESQQMSILEGMACGCKPLVHGNWIGSNDIYLPEHCWHSFQEFDKLLAEKIENRNQYREYVTMKFNKAIQDKKLLDIIRS